MWAKVSHVIWQLFYYSIYSKEKLWASLLQSCDTWSSKRKHKEKRREKMAAKVKVVVVGGGAGGSVVAYNLQDIADVTLIDSKEYYELPWAELRSMVEPSFANRSLIKHTDYLQRAKVIISTATNVTENRVITADGYSVEFDYLVIATGHAYNYPKHRNDRLNMFKQDYEKIEAARSVLIVGGGPTGVELASEIAVDFPDKKVTIVHRRTQLIEYIGEKAGKKALSWLQSKNVEVLFEQTIDLNSISESEKTYTTTAGKKITADCVFVCIGKPPGSGWLHNSTALRDSLNNKGQVMVDEHLRIKGKTNIFAVGDITDIKEVKLGFIAAQHAALVVKNMKQLMMKGCREPKLAKYKPASDMAIVSLGRKHAVGLFPFGTLAGRFPGMIKSKDLFVGSTRKGLGLEA